MKLRIAKLAILSVLSALLLSRIGLIAHEYIGHALVAHFCGATIHSCHLSMFGGGYIAFIETRFSLLSALLITSGGWIVEILLGGVALVLAQRFRKRSIFHFFLLSLGCVLIIHAFYYAISGTFYGYGDGRVLYKLYKDYIHWLTPGFVLLFVVVTYWLTWRWGNHFSKWLPDVKSNNKTVIALSCIVIAGTVQLFLLVAENHYHPDETHSLAMETESSKQIKDEMSGYLQEMKGNGNVPTNDDLGKKKAELHSKYDDFPLEPILITLMIVSTIAGVKKSDMCVESTSLTLPRWKSLVLLASCLLFVLIIIRLLPSY